MRILEKCRAEASIHAFAPIFEHVPGFAGTDGSLIFTGSPDFHRLARYLPTFGKNLAWRFILPTGLSSRSQYCSVAPLKRAVHRFTLLVHTFFMDGKQN